MYIQVSLEMIVEVLIIENKLEAHSIIISQVICFSLYFISITVSKIYSRLLICISCTRLNVDCLGI